MIRFKCNGEPYIDPLHKFTAEDWEQFGFTKEGEQKHQTDIDRPLFIDSRVRRFRISSSHHINTSIFEEAIIE